MIGFLYRLAEVELGVDWVDTLSLQSLMADIAAVLGAL